MSVQTAVGPIYQHGHLSVENAELIVKLDLTDCQFGVQIGDDGRVWVCINSISFLRFKPGPSRDKPTPPIQGHACTSCGRSVEDCDDDIRRTHKGCCPTCYRTDTHGLIAREAVDHG